MEKILKKKEGPKMVVEEENPMENVSIYENAIWIAQRTADIPKVYEYGVGTFSWSVSLHRRCHHL